MLQNNWNKRMFFTPKELANICGVCDRTIYTAIKSGAIVAVTFGNQRRIPAVEVQRIKETGWSNSIYQEPKIWNPSDYLPNKDFFHLAEMSAIINISDKSLRVAIKKGLIASSRLGNRIVLTRAMLVNFLTEGWEEADEEAK